MHDILNHPSMGRIDAQSLNAPTDSVFIISILVSRAKSPQKERLRHELVTKNYPLPPRLLIGWKLGESCRFRVQLEHPGLNADRPRFGAGGCHIDIDPEGYYRTIRSLIRSEHRGRARFRKIEACNEPGMTR